MSAFGPKQTSASALHMSAFGGKADMAFSGKSLLRSLLGVERTCPFALQMSAYDPKRTWSRMLDWADTVFSLGGGNAAARIPCVSRRCGGRVSTRRPRAGERADAAHRCAHARHR